MAKGESRLSKAPSARRDGVGIERSLDNNLRDTRTPEQCLSSLCLTEHLSDISFTFGADKSVKLPAHKLVLSMRSAVFEAMFYGSLSEVGQTVSIEDVEPEVMKVVLQYIYSGVAKINRNNVLHCLYTAKKYDLYGLVQKCSGYLENKLNESNVCSIHEQAVFYEMKPLQEKCLSFILENATSVLSSPDFLKLSYATLLNILKKDELTGDEIEIFQAVIRWAESNKKSKVGQNLRDQLGEALFQIRFPIMSIEQFARIVSPTGILTNEELVMMYQYSATKGSTSLGKFKNQERSGASVTVDLSKNASCEVYGNCDGCFLQLGYSSSPIFGRSPQRTSPDKLQPMKNSIKIKSVTGALVESLTGIKVNSIYTTGYAVKGNTVIFMNPIDIAGNTTIEFLFNNGYGFNHGNFGYLNPGYPYHITRNTNQQENIKGQTIIITRSPEGLESITFV